MKLYKYIIIAFAGLLAVACSKEDESMDQQAGQNTAEFRFEIYDAGMAGGTRATTNEAYVTSFSDGDQIGLFAVKNNAVVPGINNVCITYENEEWIFLTPVTYDSSLDGVVYYAYYPYEASVTINPSAADPLADLVSNWTIADDLSDADVYSKNDLLTASAYAALEGETYTITLPMHHRMGMVSVMLPATTYEFTNAGMSDYTAYTTGDSFTLAMGGGAATAVTPYFEPLSGTYRMLVKPVTPCTLAGTFKGRSYSIELAGGVEAGTYEPYTIDGGATTVEFTLALGDYFCADGKLVSGSSVIIPTNAIGVVYRLGTTDAIKADFPSADHALVYSIKRANDTPLVWGTSGMPTSGSWYSEYSIAYQSYGTTTGYEDTKEWQTIPSTGWYNNMVTTLNGYSDDVSLPENTTGWYVPSSGECRTLISNKTLLNTQLAAVGGEELWEGSVIINPDETTTNIYYHSSTLRTRNSVAGFNSNSGTSGNPNASYNSSVAGYFRFSFGF